MHRRTLLAALPALTALPALAQTRPVRLIVGAAAGGTTDLLARELAEELRQSLGLTAVVENRAGAGGNIAADHVAKSAPDGLTLLVAFTSHTMNAALFKRLPYDPVADFTPISQIARVSSALVVRPASPYRTLADLLAAARARPDGLSLAIGGIGSSLHMDTAQFRTRVGLTGPEVPYRGSAPALTDVLAGQVDAMFAPMGQAIAQVQGGTARVLAVSAPERVPVLPDAPTLAEALPGYPQSFGWFGLLGPAGMAPDLVERLHGVVTRAVAGERLKARFALEASQGVASAPAEFRTFLTRDIAHWQEVARAARIEPE